MPTHEQFRRSELVRLCEAMLAHDPAPPTLARELATRVLEWLAHQEAAPSYRHAQPAPPEPPHALLAALERCETERASLARELAALRAAKR